MAVRQRYLNNSRSLSAFDNWNAIDIFPLRMNGSKNNRVKVFPNIQKLKGEIIERMISDFKGADLFKVIE